MTGAVTPCGSSMASRYAFGSNRGADTSARDIYGLWGRPALRDPCRPSGAGCLELICLAQGKVILAASTFRR